MSLGTEHLDDQELISVIDGSDFEDGRSESAAHFEHCQICQQRMEKLAAEPWLWDNCRKIVESTVKLAQQVGSEPISGDFAKGDQQRRGPQKNGLDPCSLLEPPIRPEMLGRLDQYDVEAVIGQGGMGIVFKAIDADLQRTVAIKMLLPHLANHEEARKRFLREARSAAAISHEHVVDVYQVRSDARHPYLVMALVRGDSLSQIVERSGILPSLDIVRFGMQIASGLSAAHEQGLIHRDIKPANILLQTGEKKVVITDFGLARTADDVGLTSTGLIAGTPHYMSPEQCNGKSVTAATDLFGLGCVMYFMATGRPPFAGNTAMAVMNHICTSQPQDIRSISADISKPLANIIHRLIEKRPADRYSSAAETADVLRSLLAHLQEPESNRAPQVKRPPSLSKGFFRRPSLLEIAVLVTAAVCLAVKLLS
ncbi:serine/threonine protein kinase [bacterium]|nr:serine/threonine protein kinase [bacterium]